jgi:hypothetical protein
MSRNQLRLACALLSAVSMGGIAAASGAGARPADPPNFHVVATGQVGFAPGDQTNGCNFGSFLITGNAPATGTHVGGKGTLSETECATPDFVHQSNHVDGNGTITTTGGDQIFFHYGGDEPLPDLGTGNVSEELAFTITGGTGHFAGASGSGLLHSHGNFFVAVTAELDGTIAIHST